MSTEPDQVEEVTIKKRDVVPLACLWGFWKVAEALDDLVLLFVLLLQGANCTTFNTYYASYYLISSSSVGVFQGFMSGAVVDVISDYRLDRFAMCVFVLLQFFLLGLEFYPFEGYFPAVRDHEYVYQNHTATSSTNTTTPPPPFLLPTDAAGLWDWRIILVTGVWVSKWLVLTMSSNQIWKIVKIVAEDCAHRDYSAASHRNNMAAIPLKEMGGDGGGGSVCRMLEEADSTVNAFLHGNGGNGGGGGDDGVDGGDGDVHENGDDAHDDDVHSDDAHDDVKNENENENETNENNGDDDDAHGDDGGAHGEDVDDFYAKQRLLQNESHPNKKKSAQNNNNNDNNNNDDDDDATSNNEEHNTSFYVQEFSSSVGAWGDIICDSTSLFATAFVALTPYFYFSDPAVPTDTWVSTWAQFNTALYPVLAILTICHVVSLLLLMFVIVIPYEYFESKRDTPKMEGGGVGGESAGSEKGECGFYSFYVNTWSAMSSLGDRIADGLVKFWNAKIALYCMIHSLLVFALDSIIAYALALKVSSNDENLSLAPTDRHQWNLCGGLVSNLSEYDAMVCMFHLVGDFVYAILLVNMPLPRFYTIGYTTIATITVVCMSLLIFGHIAMIWKALMVACSSVALFFAVNYGYYGFSAYSHAHSFGIALQIYRVVEVLVELVVGFFMLAGTAEIYLFMFISFFLVVTVVYGYYLAWWVFPYELQQHAESFTPNKNGKGSEDGDDEKK